MLSCSLSAATRRVVQPWASTARASLICSRRFAASEVSKDQSQTTPSKSSSGIEQFAKGAEPHKKQTKFGYADRLRAVVWTLSTIGLAVGLGLYALKMSDSHWKKVYDFDPVKAREDFERSLSDGRPPRG